MPRDTQAPAREPEAAERPMPRPRPSDESVLPVTDEGAVVPPTEEPEEADRVIDKAIKDSFPASDPPPSFDIT